MPDGATLVIDPGLLCYSHAQLDGRIEVIRYIDGSARKCLIFTQEELTPPTNIALVKSGGLEVYGASVEFIQGGEKLFNIIYPEQYFDDGSSEVSFSHEERTYKSKSCEFMQNTVPIQN